MAIGLLFATSGAARTKTPRQQQILPGTASMPSVLRHPNHNKPVFVAANRVLAENGKVARRLFPSGIGRFIEQHLAMDTVGGCVELDFVDSSDLRNPEGQSFARSVREARNALVGSVTGLIPGFRDMRAGTLVRFETREILKGKGKAEHFFFFPTGNFRVGDIAICAKSSYYPKTPRIGDDLLLLLEDGQLDDQSDLLRVRSSDVITFHRGWASLPRFFDEVDPGLVGLSEEILIDRAKAAIEIEEVER